MTEKGIDGGPAHCGTCGGEVIRKSRLRLGAGGAIMIAGAGAVLASRTMWPLAVLLATTGGYLVFWATKGQGAWCRQCKRIVLT